MRASDFKFKVWDKVIKQFVHAKDVDDPKNTPVTPTKEGFKLKSRFELFQSSGLKDATGKEIYDGDVLNVLSKKKLLKDSSYVVYYEDGSFLIEEGINDMGQKTILSLSFALKMWDAQKKFVMVVGHCKDDK